MPELDEVRVDGGLSELIRRVVKEDKIEFLHDGEGNAVVALVSIGRLEQLLEKAVARSQRLREHLQRLVSDERERGLRTRALAQKLAAGEEGRLQRRNLPWEAIKADPAWQQQWDELLAEVRSDSSPDITLEEIEAEIEAAREAVYQEQSARCPASGRL